MYKLLIQGRSSPRFCKFRGIESSATLNCLHSKTKVATLHASKFDFARMNSSYSEELELALQAVHRASIVTKDVMRGISSIRKNDASPVTVADFAAQALMISVLHSKYPDDRFVAEESADYLKEDRSLQREVWDLVQSANSAVGSYSSDLPVPKDPEDMMRIIDLGSKGEAPTSGRVWIMDPVDGTATFMKGKHYIVCLSLTVDGKEKVGVLGCPNLRPGDEVREDLVDVDGYGIVLAAVKGQGTFQAPISKEGYGTRETVKRPSTPRKIQELQFIDSIKSSSAHLASHEQVFRKLELEKKHVNMWATQIKYIALALGFCDAMIRIPPNRSIRACVWDHAGGQLIFTEAGGKITDADGKEFDFAKGRKFGENWGNVCADEAVYDTVFKTVQEVMKENEKL